MIFGVKSEIRNPTVACTFQHHGLDVGHHPKQDLCFFFARPKEKTMIKEPNRGRLSRGAVWVPWSRPRGAVWVPAVTVTHKGDAASRSAFHATKPPEPLKKSTTNTKSLVVCQLLVS